MVRKIKFPLEMKDGVKVRTLEELRENFDLEKIIEYFLDGRLQVWLKDRRYTREVNLISELKYIDEEDLIESLCQCFYIREKENFNIDKIKKRINREKKLLTYTDDSTWKEKIDSIALNQEELERLVKNNSTIYLAGDEFKISLENKNITYIGINIPCVYISSKQNSINLDKLNIYFNNVFIKSKNKITLRLEKSRAVKLDKNIKTTFIPSTITKNIDFSNDFSWEYTRFDIYKNYLIYWNNRSMIFGVLDINTNKEILNKKDIAPSTRGWHYQYVDNAKVYKNFLIVYWGEHENTALQVVDLNTLKSLNIVELCDHYDIKGKDVIVDVYNDIIGLYEQLIEERITLFDSMKCQYHRIDTLKFIGRDYLNLRHRYNGYYEHGTVYNGYAYCYNSYENNIISNKEEYKCKGLWNKNERGAVGKFHIKNDNIYATISREHATHKKQYNSIPNEGEICEFDLEGGEVKRRLKTKFEDITGFICLEDSIAIWNNKCNKIVFYSLDTLEEIKTLEVPIKIQDSITRINICYVKINEEEQKMCVLCNGEIIIFE